MEGNNLPGFPNLTENYLRDLTLGVYQLKLAKSYVQDKVERDAEYKFEVLLEEPGILRARTYSRFSASVKHLLWIAFNETHFSEDENVPILSWYCKCKAGARTVGCCAHIASVLWYMGFARHEKINYPSKRLLFTVLDAASDPLVI
jgi:hypothetical protein